MYLCRCDRRPVSGQQTVLTARYLHVSLASTVICMFEISRYIDLMMCEPSYISRLSLPVVACLSDYHHESNELYESVRRKWARSFLHVLHVNVLSFLM